MPITASILETAAAHPERLALAGDGEALGYAALVEDSRRVFAVVDALHAESGERAPRPAAETRGIPITAVSVRSAFHTARILAGLSGYRAVSATLDPRWPLQHRVRVVLATGIGVVIADDPALADALAAAGWGGRILGLDEFRARERTAVPAAPPCVRAPDEAFLLLFSSGTTSDPKAFLKTRAQYRANLAVSSAHLEPGPGVVTLAPGPVSYSLTLYAVIECLGTGGAAHLADAFSPFALAARIAEAGVSRVVAVPAVVQAIADAARRDPAACATLDLVVTGGAHLSAALRDALAQALPAVRLISYYGAAEIGFIGDSRGGDGSRIAVYPGIGAAIRDAAGAALPDGEIGTLWISADACSDGYLAGTSPTQLRGPDGWASVGDQGRLIGGELELLGRAGDIAVTGGHKVALPEVERAFAGMPGIGEACAVALPHARLGSVVALVVEEAPDAASSPSTRTDPSTRADHSTRADPSIRAALAARAAERLAPQFVPRRWYRIARLPRTVGGKIRRGETAEAIADGRAVRL
ncbi:acyl--CoA ligase [Leucobacter allii]|uniref:Acyl--CoA ligase n=1 Tax=Leucobacter allii TaxID=2932247 RepID=A0ABY4FHZ9_9MICO|nr:class I adenylate-forming enzyme family protein [Leucobacter allii]UOQ56284.1 acyl--CoA ligase [Leucobacter allii]